MDSFMKIVKALVGLMRNNGHFQFYTDLIKLLESAGEPLLTQLKTLYDTLRDLHGKEDEALKKIRKSSLTESITAMDTERTQMYRGIVETCQTSTRHYDAKVSAAARRLMLVFDTYGNIARIPQDEKTSAIYNLTTELENNHQEDVETAGLVGWGSKLVECNDSFAELVRDRDSEISGRSTVALRSIRKEMDITYRLITHCIESLWIMAPKGENREYFAAIIHRMNTMSERYNNRISIRRGQGVNDAGNADAGEGADDADMNMESAEPQA
jgi:hypothetical protein